MEETDRSETLTAPASDARQKTPDRAEPLSRRTKLIFVVCSASIFMSALDLTVVATALPRIGHALHSPINWTAWTITIYQLGQVIAAPIAGRISDQFGRKRIFLVCIALFTLSSVGCALSTQIYMLVPIRLIQALGGGGFLASTGGIVSDHFGKERDRAMGLFTSFFPAGTIIGPIVGGVVTQFWTWRGIFFINVPIGITLFFMALYLIPQSPPKPTKRFDFFGVALLVGTIAIGMDAISTLGEANTSLGDARVFVPAIVAVGLGAVFVRHTRVSSAPFINRRILTGRGFGIMNFLNFFYGTATVGFSTLVPLYAENRYQFSISSAGSVVSARGVGYVATSATAALLIRRTGYRLPMIVGFGLISVSLIFLSISPQGIPVYWWLAVFAAITGLGMGTAAPSTNNASLHQAPDQVAALVGLRQMFRQAGGIFYLSITSAILARSLDPGMAQAHMFFIQAIILMGMTGLVFLVPEHKGRW